MRRVVHVGPLMAPGGMSSVIKLLAANPPKGWRASSCNTYSRRGKLQKLRRWRLLETKLRTAISTSCTFTAHLIGRTSVSCHCKGCKCSSVFHIHSGRFDIDTKSDLDNYHVVCLSKSWSERLKPLIGDSLFQILLAQYPKKELTGRIHTADGTK